MPLQAVHFDFTQPRSHFQFDFENPSSSDVVVPHFQEFAEAQLFVDYSSPIAGPIQSISVPLYRAMGVRRRVVYSETQIVNREGVGRKKLVGKDTVIVFD